MEKAVLTVFGRHESEKIIEKSRFLTYSAHVESEADARAFLSEVKALHPLATHCCYAFVADKAGNLRGFPTTASRGHGGDTHSRRNQKQKAV